MNEQSRRSAIAIGGVLVVAAIALGFYIMRGSGDETPTASGGGIYYTGPMKAKGGGGGYGTIDGKAMSGEEGKAAASAWLKKNPQLASDSAQGSSGSHQAANSVSFN